MDIEKIGKAIKELRIRAGYTQSELAERLDVTDKAVSRWERCLGIPDVSLLAKLCNILNTDIDNLLEGNITYLEHSWHGVLILDETRDEIFPDTMIQGKRSIYIPMSYFFLVGIKQVTILGNGEYLDAAKRVLGYGEKYGACFEYCCDEKSLLEGESPVMIVHSNAFLYGPNLTRYFQRAIANTTDVSYLAVPQTKGEGRNLFDNTHIIKKDYELFEKYKRIPICFCRSHNIDVDQTTEKENVLYTIDTLGRGMIYRTIDSWKDVSEISNFIRFIEDTTGDYVYCLEEIAWRRGLIVKEQLTEIADEKTTYGQYLLSIIE